MMATMMVKGASNIMFMFLNKLKISFKSTFYSWINYESGIRSRHSLAILRDLDMSFLASVLSTLMASSLKIRLECSEKNIRRNCTATKT